MPHTYPVAFGIGVSKTYSQPQHMPYTHAPTYVLEYFDIDVFKKLHLKNKIKTRVKK